MIEDWYAHNELTLVMLRDACAAMKCTHIGSVRSRYHALVVEIETELQRRGIGVFKREVTVSVGDRPIDRLLSDRGGGDLHGLLSEGDDGERPDSA